MTLSYRYLYEMKKARGALVRRGRKKRKRGWTPLALMNSMESLPKQMQA
jgi:hypothetical protein